MTTKLVKLQNIKINNNCRSITSFKILLITTQCMYLLNKKNISIADIQLHISIIWITITLNTFEK